MSVPIITQFINVALRRDIRYCNSNLGRVQDFDKFEHALQHEAVQKLGSHPKIEDFKRVSHLVGTTIKNLKRWYRNGTERKKGCGRKKLNPIAERALIDWVLKQVQQTGKKISRQQLKNKAIELFSDKRFCASKGFLDKFVRQHQLKQKMIDILKRKGKYSGKYHYKKYSKKAKAEEDNEETVKKEEQQDVKVETEQFSQFH